MKIVVIGGTGNIGTKVVKRLTAKGHEALAAAPNTGVDATTGRGLADALAGADVVVDVSNAPNSSLVRYRRTSTRVTAPARARQRTRDAAQPAPHCRACPTRRSRCT